MVVQRDRVASVLLLVSGRKLKLRSAGAKGGICSIALGVITLTGAKESFQELISALHPQGVSDLRDFGVLHKGFYF